MKVPEDLVRISDEPQEIWVANLPDWLDYSWHQQLNNCRQLTFLRKAQAVFVKAYDEFYQLGACAVEAYHLYLDPLERRWPLPSFTMGNKGAVREYLTWRCSTCGNPHHRHECCNKKSKIPLCSMNTMGLRIWAHTQFGLALSSIRTLAGASWEAMICSRTRIKNSPRGNCNSDSCRSNPRECWPQFHFWLIVCKGANRWSQTSGVSICWDSLID
jgi:hypothetical protein